MLFNFLCTHLFVLALSLNFIQKYGTDEKKPENSAKSTKFLFFTNFTLKNFEPNFFWIEKMLFEKKPCSIENFERKISRKSKGRWIVHDFRFLKKFQNLNIHRELISISLSDAFLVIMLLVIKVEILRKWKDNFENVFIVICCNNQS